MVNAAPHVFQLPDDHPLLHSAILVFLVLMMIECKPKLYHLLEFFLNKL